MKPQWIVIASLFFFITGIAIGFWIGGTDRKDDQETLYQVSTIDALLQGSYEGFVPYAEFKKHGDFGISTFDSLDGEMIAFEGKFFQIRADGKVIEVTNEMTTPFGSITYFSPDYYVPVVYASNITDFARQVEAVLPSKNYMYAVFMRGEFPYMETRSIPRQERPYPRMVDASANQSVFTFYNTSGVVVGFWTPELVEGLNVPGFHLHYLTDDRTGGGHIQNFIVDNVTVELDLTPQFTIVLPTEGSFSVAELSGNLSSDLETVEKGGSRY
ncbi:MAG: Alpha-acetolactate decarboxylase [Methanoregulaceae archaeon PtaU1.Bin222]|nr:MAG: Alpha-acetolactate decarboxylase [Methanoregulaceae archaeon PtaU1.Bin222]